MAFGLSSLDHIFVAKAGAAEKVAHSVPCILQVEKPLNLAIVFCLVEKSWDLCQVSQPPSWYTRPAGGNICRRGPSVKWSIQLLP